MPLSIDVTLEPTVDNVLRYLLCAPSAAGEPETGLLNLYIKIKNTGSKDLRFNRITIFVEGDHTNEVMDLPVILPDKRPLLAPNRTVDWVSPDYIFRPGGNLRLYLKIYSADRDDPPHEEIINIHRHTTPGGGYHLWSKTADLEE